MTTNYQFFYCRNRHHQIQVIFTPIEDRDEQRKFKGLVESDLIFLENDTTVRVARAIMESYKQVVRLEFAPRDNNELGEIYDSRNPI